ncbi:MAG: hypothetical protein ABSD31_15735, partial [Candidatus Binataceae bacterium]
MRKAIDRPEARLARKEDKKEKRRPFFHEALYSYLKKSPQGRNVYARLVEPAEYTVDEHTYLDAARFRSLIEAEKAQTGDVSYPISPRTENEALALFALAFGLLEPEDSYAILEPLLLMGAGFRQFFGIGESAPDVSEQESSTAGSRSSVQKATTRDSVNADGRNVAVSNVEHQPNEVTLVKAAEKTANSSNAICEQVRSDAEPRTSADAG